MKSFVADFETIVHPDHTRVWLWGYSEIGNVDNFRYGTTIESFFMWCKKSNKEIYFHNLKFDGEFLFHYLLSNGYTYSTERESNTFNCIVSAQGQFYSIEVIFEKKNKKYKKVTFYDSFKKLPFKVAEIGKAFGLPYNKIEVEEEFYTRYRDIDHVPTQEEIDYLEMDLKTVATALGIQFDQDLKKMTVGSDAIHSYKMLLGGGDKSLGEREFKRKFPTLPLATDMQIRFAYRGGFTYVNPRYQGKDIGTGIVFDVNSLYPYVMYAKVLPKGIPLPFKGKYKPDRTYPLYIQKLKCEFTLKENHIPTIQLKNTGRFGNTEYLTTSTDKFGESEVTLVLSSVDLQLFFDHYNVNVVEWQGGWKFKKCQGEFREYIDHWMAIKENSEGALRTLAKLQLNNLYGKFATNPDISGKHPFLHEDGSIGYKLNDTELRDPVYTAMGVFITAYAREMTIRTAQKVYDRFIYADTDSLHLIGDEMPDIEVHPTHLGAWKHEGTFTKGRFLRAKTYVEEIEGKLQVTCAGMPDNVKELVTWENFHIGLTLHGKKRPKHVTGGIVLENSDFTIL